MPRLALPLLATFLLLVACGRRGPAPHAGPLTPDLYLIDEDDRPEPGAFLRFSPPGPHGGGLDIAVTEYVHPDSGPPVHLVGVVHIADPLYFQRIQEVLDAADLVLYEAVKPADVAVTEWIEDARKDVREIEGFQQELASWFGFVFQLEALSYDRPHFSHADMTLEVFLEEGGGKFFPDLELSSESGSPSDALPSGVQETYNAVRAFGRMAMSEPNPVRSLARRMFAEVMGTTDIESSLDMIPGLSELLLTKRNDVAMDRLEEVLPDFEGTVAVFYGAAHMPDMEERLLEDLGYERKQGQWLRAWALRKPLPK